MISIILLGSIENEKLVADTMSALKANPLLELVLIAKTRPVVADVNYKFVPTGSSSPSACIAIAAGMTTGDTVLFVDGRASIKDGSMLNVLASIDSSTGVTWFPVEIERNGKSEIVELEENTPEALLRAITSDNALPTAAVAIRSSLLPKSEMPEADSAGEMLAKLMAQGIGEQSLTIRGDMMFSARAEVCTLSDKARASCLKVLANSSNIEDLFPHHDWITHEKESAAAAYHTMAALFLRVGDTASSMECLKLSDQLEDSPRSLALKGLIAIDRGEILGAVANMVSSLQQYEIRKKENEIHYSRFQPTDLEVINENLNAGLQALNKRDNERALNHFATAVFNFDPFYSKYGVDRVSK